MFNGEKEVNMNKSSERERKIEELKEKIRNKIKEKKKTILREK